MKRILWLLLWAVPAGAQISNPGVIPGPAPGSCNGPIPLWSTYSTGVLQICDNGIPVNVGGGSSVTFAGDLSGTSSSQEVVGMLGTAICTGAAPATGNVWQLITTGSPNPCWQSQSITGVVTGTATQGYIPYMTNAGGNNIGTSTIDHNITSATTDTDSQAFAASSLLTTGTAPGASSLVAGTGNILALKANSAGFAAPTTGGTAYLFKLPGTITGSGFLHAAPTATADNVNESALTIGSSTRAETGAYNPVAADCGNIITMASASNMAMAFPQAGSAGFPSGCQITVINNNSGGIVLATSTTSVFNYNGSAGRTYWFQGIDNTATYTSDGSNWSVQTAFPQLLYVKHSDSCLSAVATANQTIGYTGSTVSCVAAWAGGAGYGTYATGSFTFPANFFSATTEVKITDQFAATSGGTNESGRFTLQLGGSSVLDTGTGLQIFFCGASASVTNCLGSQEFYLNGTAAPGGSVVVAAGWGARAAFNEGVTGGAAATWFANFATNGTLALTQNFEYTGTQAGNWNDMFATDIYWMHY